MKFLFILGALILFLGLLWMFLPHQYHEAILTPEQEEEHYIHIIQGIIPTILGIILMNISEKRSKNININKTKPALKKNSYSKSL